MPSAILAQNCPDNIGFEMGNFTNWKLYTGTTFITAGKNTISTTEDYNPIVNRHTIINGKSLIDPYGEFPLSPNNGGNFTVKLGNDGTKNQAEGISYLLTVPSDRPEFTLTYQYAVVLEDPSHFEAEQPRFIARVKDLTTNEYIPCASFEYISTSNLPGFKHSKTNSTIIYKEWTPVTLNLTGYQGKNLLVEFITADCTLGGHFGYAYIDVNNLCGNLIVGNNYCKGSNEINVSGPSGFQVYNWYNEDRTIKYGSGQSIAIKPALPDGSKIYLDLVPYEGFGCPSTVSVMVSSVSYDLVTLPKDVICYGTALDLTSDKYILNKRADFDYLIYEDKDLTQLVKNPIIRENKTYYIKATNYKGCESISTIDISLNGLQNVVAGNPDMVCYDETVDITKNEMYKGDLVGVKRAYFADAEAKTPLNNPTNISVSGIYYAQLTNDSGCSKILPIQVSLRAKPKLIITKPEGICFPGTIDISNSKNFAGSDADLILSFYEDELLTKPISDPKNIAVNGTFYVKAVNPQGCMVSGQITTKIYSLPILVLKNPDETCYPSTVDITNKNIYQGSSENCTLSFFSDKDLTNKISQPNQIAQSGTYFVKLTNANGCYKSDKIEVTINPLPSIVLNKPKTIFDYEFIDLTNPELIKGSKNFVKVDYYLDAHLMRKVADPTKVNKPGVYYISITNNKGCSVSSSIELDILPTPKIIVPTAFTPQQQNNNRLYPFFVSIKKLISFKIYNKWGMLVYETDAMQDSGWDGQFKSKLQPFETFSWFAEGLDVLGGKYQSTGKTIMIL